MMSLGVYSNARQTFSRVSKSSGPLVDYVKSDAETDYRELNLSDG